MWHPLDDVPPRSCLQRLVNILVSLVGRQHDESRLRLGRANRANDVDADQNLTDAGLTSLDIRCTLAITDYRFVSLRTAGRYPIESNTSIFDLLAQAGGVKDDGSDTVFLLRQDREGKEIRVPIDLKGLADGRRTIPNQTLKGGDTVFVPKAQLFSIYGEVTTPGRYRVEPNMTVIEAIAKAGGITQRGSARRVEIKRRLPNGDYANVKARFGDAVQPDDVIHVKESIF